MCVYRGVRVGCYSVFTVVSLYEMDVTVCVYRDESVRVGCYSVCLPW